MLTLKKSKVTRRDLCQQVQGNLTFLSSTDVGLFYLILLGLASMLKEKKLILILTV